MKPVISIVIPVYNIRSDYLTACIRSATSQTLQDIEIICVDDCSTNNSLSLLREAARRDRRIRVIALDHNRGTCYARKAGVEAARGKYLLFLDADDTLEPDACSILYKQMMIHNVDILQFETRIIAESYLEPERILRSARNLQPYHGYLYGQDVLNGCFRNTLYRFTVWNKMYRTAMVKKAFRCLSADYLVKAEDAYTYFVIACHAKSYYGLSNCRLYNYHFGCGITGRTELSLRHLDLYCQNMCSWDALNGFVRSRNLAYYKNVFLPRFRMDLLMDCLKKYFVYLPQYMQEEGMNILRSYWREDELNKGFARIALPMAG